MIGYVTNSTFDFFINDAWDRWNHSVIMKHYGNLGEVIIRKN